MIQLSSAWKCCTTPSPINVKKTIRTLPILISVVVVFVLISAQRVDAETHISGAPVIVPLNGRLTPGVLGWTELMEAVLDGDSTTARQLLTNGAQVNVRARTGDAALTIAAYRNDSQMILLLLEGGADVNIRGRYDETALILAAQHGNSSILNLLLARGADVHLRGQWNQTALYRAAFYGHAEIVRILLVKGATSEEQEEALLVAASKGRVDVIKEILATNVDVNARDKNGQTALLLAAQDGQTETVKLLLSHGAMPDMADNRGTSPMFRAITRGDVETARSLLVHGAKPDAVNAAGESMLQLSAASGNQALVVLLLDYGAQDDLGYHALVAADRAGHRAVVDTLLVRHSRVSSRPLLIAGQKAADGCVLLKWDPQTQERHSLSFGKSCPEKLYVSEQARVLIAFVDDSLQIVHYQPRLSMGTAVTSPFHLASISPGGEVVGGAGMLRTGELAVVKRRYHPADDSDNELYVFNAKHWELKASKHCNRWEPCRFELVDGRHWQTWPEENQIWHPLMRLNSYVVSRDTNTPAGDRQLRLNIDGHDSALSYLINEGPDSGEISVVAAFLRIGKSKNATRLCEDFCSTALVGRYLLVRGHYEAGPQLVDLKTGEEPLRNLQFAVWVH